MLYHFPTLAMPTLFDERIPMPDVILEGVASYLVDPRECYLEEGDCVWVISYRVGPDGLTLQTVEREDMQGDMTLADLRQHYEHYPDAWTRMAEVCLRHLQDIVRYDARSLANSRVQG